MKNRHVRRWSTVALVVLASAGSLMACSSGSSGGSGSATTTVVPVTPPREDAVSKPIITGPVTGGNGKPVLGPGGFDLASVGYTEEEFFQSGTANSYTSSVPLGSDGVWNMTTAATAPYTTRIVVRRPTDPSKFNGTVLVEWLNVSGGLDAGPDWTYTHVELIRSGYTWVGVSAQSVGIVGGGNALGAALALKNADAVRYASLSHPGDDFSYDMYSQAGAAVWFQSDAVLGGLKPERVVAVGESQSAFRLTSYVDGIAPLVDIYDGYLIHSSGAVGARFGEGLVPADPTFIRSDLNVPVLNFSTETDLVGRGLGYERARQPDTDLFRGWEVAGTAHADAYNLGIGDSDNGDGAGDAALFQAMLTPSAELYGGIISCASPINTGPHTYVLRSAVVALNDWIRTGVAPSSRPRIEVSSPTSLALASNGQVLGGIRTPQVDVPVAVLSGLGQTGNSFCGLFGTTVPMAVEMYMPQGRQPFIDSWLSSLDEAVTFGAILPADAERLRSVVQNANLGASGERKVPM
jgi:hypothetical protein